MTDMKRLRWLSTSPRSGQPMLAHETVEARRSRAMTVSWDQTRLRDRAVPKGLPRGIVTARAHSDYRGSYRKNIWTKRHDNSPRQRVVPAGLKDHGGVDDPRQSAACGCVDRQTLSWASMGCPLADSGTSGMPCRLHHPPLPADRASA